GRSSGRQLLAPAASRRVAHRRPGSFGRGRRGVDSFSPPPKAYRSTLPRAHARKLVAVARIERRVGCRVERSAVGVRRLRVDGHGRLRVGHGPGTRFARVARENPPEAHAPGAARAAVPARAVLGGRTELKTGRGTGACALERQ